MQDCANELSGAADRETHQDFFAVDYPSEVFRIGLTSCLVERGFLACEVAEVFSVKNARRPAVVICTVSDAITMVSRANREPSTVAVVGIGDSISPRRLAELLIAGCGVADVNSPVGFLADCVSAALGGNVLLPKGAVVEILNVGPKSIGSLDRPTERQLKLLQRYSEGVGIRALAQEMFLGERTVRREFEAACATLGVSSRSEAIKIAAQGHLIE